jgi:hypothetical protein
MPLEGEPDMETTPITAQQPVIDVGEIVARVEELSAQPVLSDEQAKECEELLRVIAQTTRMEGCDYFTPMLYRFDSLPQRLDGIVDEIEVTFYGVAYTAVSTVAG